MKILFLLRHARAGSAPPGKPDHDRPLTPEGEKAAQKLGNLLAEMALVPETALFSSARRAEDTFTNLAAGSGISIPAEATEWLYHAAPHDILDQIRHLPDTRNSVLVVGHNPTMHSLAHDLAKGSPMARKLASAFPPGTMAVFHFPVSSWQETQKEHAQLAHIFFPES